MRDQPTTFAAPERSRPFGRFAFLPAVLALGLVVLSLPLEPRSLAQGDEKELKPFRQDFRGQKVNDELMRYMPPNAWQQMKEEPEGLLISIPVKNIKQDPVGVAPKFRVKGDCEITTSYELLKADRPAKGYGQGVSLYITTTPSKDAVMLANFYRVDEGHVYTCERLTGPNTNRRRIMKPFPTDARAGKLRLVRRGAFVTCLVAEGNNDFRELHQFELGLEELSLVRAAAHTNDPALPVEVRIHDFEIRPLEVALAVPVLAPPETSLPPEERGWVLWAELLGLAFVLALAASLGVWLYRRQSCRKRGPDQNAPIEPEALVVAFACLDCGKKLMARTELAGKKVKCSQCGQAVLVPADRGEQAGRFSS
jgi:hypothetical protein